MPADTFLCTARPPLFLPVLGVSLANSAAATVWRGGVRRRGASYPLAALRAGLVK
jgi:hypothetical protein